MATKEGPPVPADSDTEWTIMVYLAGDNNLSEECVFALTEMKKMLPTGKISIFAQFDPNDALLPTHRYEINGDKIPLSLDIIDQAQFNERTREVHFKKESRRARQLARERIAEAQRILETTTVAAKRASLGSGPEASDANEDDTDTGSPIPLYNFLSFCIEKRPAKHYMAVISGHGAGTQRDFLLSDTSPAGYLTLNELKQVFTRLKGDLKDKTLDILGMDNCLMSMTEVCYELRGLVQIIVGCESYSPASGWPYRAILDRLRKDFLSTSPTMKALQSADKPVQDAFAEAIVEEYTNFYVDYWLGGMSVAQSALDVRQVGYLKEAVDALADALVTELLKEDEAESAKPPQGRTYPLRDALILAHWEAQSYNGELFVDLFDFCDCLQKRHPQDPVAPACEALKQIIGRFVLKSCYNGATYQYSYGISIYFPWSQVANSYTNLDFVKGEKGENVIGGWGRFLEAYTILTRRQPRGIAEDRDLGKVKRFAEADSAVSALVRKTGDKKTGDKGTVSGNAICSMRNPPIVFVPDKCIRQRTELLAAEEELLIPHEAPKKTYTRKA